MIWLYFACSYFIGCIMFGYLITKLLFHQDIRRQGSGNVGARNAGRLYGKKAFVITFLGDALKGILIILIGRYLGFSESIQLLGLAFAIIGHLKPVTLKFKGGKGISTFIGGMVAFEPFLAPVFILAFLVTYPFTKSFTFSGLGAFLVIPVFLFIQHDNWETGVLAIIILALILLAHSENIKVRLKK
ncbi:glycerol-3-phosphate acyltransferase [Paenibacillus sp. BSR1-1]|uniref:glycerol-3-phosphate acyltransferase n=1 Tax=Paenibacillus sp. BSR1-1 TaxID=3020845 RepID=UPI0025B12028|nr:glycerol-3-phosphate acyltransferase [Paenibacillus sp. BSR1-1]MDN3017873.1 glycerol-3-phosphate acyltransferase [Paenibacillus sp. BSR1-1]